MGMKDPREQAMNLFVAMTAKADAERKVYTDEDVRRAFIEGRAAGRKETLQEWADHMRGMVKALQ